MRTEKRRPVRGQTNGSSGLERWSDEAGYSVLERLARAPASLRTVADTYALPFSERAVLRRVLTARLERTAPRRNARNQLTVWVRRVAEELDFLRTMEQRLAAEHPFPRQRAFKGNHDHLKLLERSVYVPIPESEWNHWRAHARRVVPDLRGANLSGLQLQHLDLDRARLSDADLSGARVSSARAADMRRARLVGSDLGHAELRGANLTGALLRRTDLTQADLSRATLRDANLISCTLNRAMLEGADLRHALVWGASVWEATYDGKTKQTDLYLAWEGFDSYDDYDWRRLRRPDRSIRVDSLDLAGVMALVKRQPKTIGELLKTVSDRMVLLLGRFTGPHELPLRILEEALGRDYTPVRFDFDPTRDQIDTVAALAGLCRFIVADISDPRSVLIEAQRIIPAFSVPFVPILERTSGPVAMFDTLQRKYPWVVDTFVYQNHDHLRRSVTRQIVVPAEQRLIKLRRMMRWSG